MLDLQSLHQRLERTTPRERLILIAGVPVALVLAVYLLLVQPAADLRDLAQRDLDIVTQQLQARIEGDSASATTVSCNDSTPTLFDMNAPELVQVSAARLSLTPVLSSCEQMRLEQAEGRRVLQLVDALTCAGIPVLALELAHPPGDPGYDAALTLPEALWPGTGEPR